MHIFIMRHGEAGFHAFNDKDRPLTARGEDQAEQQGLWLNEQTVPDLILVSPYLRAQQTYQLARQPFKQSIPVETWDNLTPYGNAALVADYLDTLNENIQSVLIVSHLPLVDDIVTELGVHEPISFYPATIVHLEKQQDTYRLVEVKFPTA